MKDILKSSIKELIVFSLKAIFVFILVITTVILSFNYFFNNQRDINSQKTFSVNGEATRKVKPDGAKVVVGTILDGKNVLEIQTSATNVVNKSIDAIKALGIEEKNIQTSNYDLTPVINYQTNKTESYRINISITVTIDALTNDASKNIVGDVIKASTNSGLNEVRSLVFQIKDKQKILDELKVEAINDAKSKKDVLANASNVRLGDILSINFAGETPIYYYGNQPAAIDKGEDTSGRDSVATTPSVNVSPGENELKINVTIVYKII